MYAKSRNNMIIGLRLLLAAVVLLSLLTARNSSPTMAVALSGTVVAWGKNDAGQTNVPAGLDNVIAVAGGGYHSLALKSDGTVIAWGCGINNLGQCTVPSGLSDVIAIAAGNTYSLALKSDGTVVEWGWQQQWWFPRPFPDIGYLSDVIAIDSNHQLSMALKSDGTLVVWGDGSNNGIGSYVGFDPDLSGVTAIAASGMHPMVLMSDGTLKSWGDVGYWMCLGETVLIRPFIPEYSGTVTAIDKGVLHSLVLLSDGAVVGVSSMELPEPCVGTDFVIPEGLSDVIAIAAGNRHSLALKEDGTVVAWGFNDDGQTDVPAGLVGVIAIAAGQEHNLAIVGHYNFIGFTWPVENPDVLNFVKAGQTVPLQWRLLDAYGVPITDLASVAISVENLSCEAGDEINLVSEEVAGKSGLQNLGDGYYQWNWKTPKSYANSCKTLILDLGDNTVHTALFKFK